MSLLARASRYQVALGVSLGLAASLVVLSLHERGEGMLAEPATAPLLSECDGALRQLVLHYAAGAAETLVPTYRAFLRQLPADVTVYALCPEPRDFEDLRTRVGPTRCALESVIVNHPVTVWSRDRWLALGAAENPKTVLLSPRGEDGAAIWPARQGDQRVAWNLAAALGRNVVARRSDLAFDGGDFAADSETVFVRPRTLVRNLQRTIATREELVHLLASLLKRRAVLFHDAPEHHVAMYLMPIGNRTVLVGDPKMTERLLDKAGERAAVDAYLPGGADFSASAVARFEAVAEQCRAAGYRVVRIPLAPGRDGRTYITYVNAILDQRDGRRIVYMPTFRRASELNREAAGVWTEMGFEVRPVECDACARHFGTLHCLVNVLRRG
ncbi:MAG: agmatine deiminase family protein [Pirellulales bacterium]